MSKSWSIHTRPEITSKYEIQERVGSGTYSDVYKARRLSDNAIVALKEVHDYQAALREIEALQILHNCPNVVVMHEYFWDDNDDAVLVLEFLRTDLAAVIRGAKKKNKSGCGFSVGEVKRWMIQILSGVDGCHRNMILHRDLKPSNLLISDDGVLKLADFGQARILVERGFVADANGQPYNPNPSDKEDGYLSANVAFEMDNLPKEGHEHEEQGIICREDSFRDVREYKAQRLLEETDKEANIADGNTSCMATGTASDFGDEMLRTSYSYEAEDGRDDAQGSFTSCVGTRWYRAPELLYGSTNYGLEVDLWSLGCIFAELLNLEPLFPGTSDIDQISRIISVLGNLTEDVWPGCAELPDYKTISFAKVENPMRLDTCLPNHSHDEVALVKKLLCYNPARRATAMELLRDEYFSKDPLPVPLSELQVPLTTSGQGDDSPVGLCDYNDKGSDSDFDDFAPINITTTGSGFSIRFS